MAGHPNAARFCAVLGLACLALAQTDVTDGLEAAENATETACTSSDFISSMCLEKIDNHAFGVLLEAFIFMMSFLALAIVCDDYLVLSLETLCVRWGVREDVAGATFMAFGSAAPEIIVNAVATIKAQSGGVGSEGSTDQGISAILGSGMIAFMLIPGCCGVFGGRATDLELKRRPLVRDISAYLIGLFELCFFFRDNRIDLYEGLIMLCTYVGYVCVVVFAPKVRRAYRRHTGVDEQETVRLLDDDDTAGGAGGAQRVHELGVTFLSRDGEKCEFPGTGPLVRIEGTAHGSVEAGVKFIVSDEYVLEVLETEGDAPPVRVALAQKGCERTVAKVSRVLMTRGVPVQQEWVVGTAVSVKHKGVWAAATVAEVDAEGYYTVRVGGDAGATQAMLAFCDIRHSKESEDPEAAMSPDSPKAVFTKRTDALRRAREEGELDEEEYAAQVAKLGQLRSQHEVDFDDIASGTTNCTAISQWRRHWWKEGSVYAGSEGGGGGGLPAWCRVFAWLSIFVRFWQFVFKHTIPAHEIDEVDEDGRELHGIQSEAEPAEESWRAKIYPVTFIVSFLWVSLFSFVISNVAGRWATLSGLGQGFMGLILISIGAEIPDCIQSVTCAKRGLGSMAVSNAIGSQCVNVFIGLGLPWFLSNVAGSAVHINDVDSLRVAAFFDIGGVVTCVTMLLVLAVVMGKTKAQLGARKGYYLMGAYFVVVTTYAIYSAVTG